MQLKSPIKNNFCIFTKHLSVYVIKIYWLKWIKKAPLNNTVGSDYKWQRIFQSLLSKLCHNYMFLAPILKGSTEKTSSPL